MELIQRAIEGAPPTYTEREDVGEQLGQAIVDLASAPGGGVFSCRWIPSLHVVHWGYVWINPTGCRSALIGQVITHDRHIPVEWVEVENQDRYVGLPECHARWEEAALSATGDSVYRSNEF